MSTAVCRSGRLRGEAGQVSAFLVVFALALFALAGLVIDGGRALAAKRFAMDEAEQAARAGADALSQAALREGRLALDVPAAIAAAEASMAAAGHPGVAWVSGASVTAEVSAYQQPTVVLSLVGMSHFRISATASATDVAGIDQGGQR